MLRSLRHAYFNDRVVLTFEWQHACYEDPVSARVGVCVGVCWCVWAFVCGSGCMWVGVCVCVGVWVLVGMDVCVCGCVDLCGCVCSCGAKHFAL